MIITYEDSRNGATSSGKQDLHEDKHAGRLQVANLVMQKYTKPFASRVQTPFPPTLCGTLFMSRTPQFKKDRANEHYR